MAKRTIPNTKINIVDEQKETDKVIEDLEDFYHTTCPMASYSKIIRIYDYYIQRDDQTNLVIGIKPNK